MERYSEYKDSGVKWLGEIPSHWELLKSKYLWKETFENSTSGKEDLLSVSQYTGVTKSKADSRSESLIGYKIVHKDDLVINIMLAWLGGLGVSSDEGVVSPAYCTYKLIRDYNPKFLHYLYKTPMYLAEFARHSTGVVPSRWRMYTDDFGQVVSLLPPVEEQDAIVRYLDAATSKIDKAIAMQQKMIDLLNERKQIIIQNAVTKGLDENVEMKDSGVEWIGMIPKHWEIKRLKYVMHSYGRIGFRGYGTDDIVDEGQGAITLSPSNIQDSSMDYSKKTYLSWKKYYESPEIMIKNGDVLMVKTGSSYGKCAVVKDLPMECTINPQLVVFKEHKEFSEFLAYSFQTTFAKCFINTSVIGGTIPTISQEKINNYIFPFPSKSEQQAIVAYLDKEMQRFDSAITNCQRQITLLQERKQIIINEVVTGKVKVS